MVVGGEHVASVDGSGVRWMDAGDAPDGEWLFLGTPRRPRPTAPSWSTGWTRRLHPASLRMLGPTVAPEDASLAVHAVGLSRWHQTHRFCARCGRPTVVAQAGHTRDCPSCGATHFPRTDPAVIMLITDGDDRALLGRQPSWPELASPRSPGSSSRGSRCPTPCVAR